jgi:PAS domain S-box-containing protein
LLDIGISLATRVRFRQLISEGKWDEAVAILRSVPKDFPFIDRLFLSDVNGTLMADTPELPNVRGKNFASRGWYQGVSSKWEPHISEVYKRAAEPRLNVIAVAIPIKDEHQKILGILVLQVRLDALFEWTKGIDVGPLGSVFFVDKKGHLAAHPTFSPQGEIVDYSGAPAVQKILQGRRGIEILFDPIENVEYLTAYEPVAGYGWGIVARQPSRVAFAARSVNLKWLVLAYGVVLVLSCALAYLLARFFSERKSAEEKFRAVAETANDAIVSADSNGNIIYFNKAAGRIFGYSEGDAVGRPLTLLMPERFHDAHRQGLRRFLSTGEAHVIGKTVELVGTRRDGTEFPLELSLATWKNGTETFFTGILRDMTDRKRADEEVRKMNAELQAANKELEAFSYSVSHDLRAPLRAVDGFSRILVDEHTSHLPEEGQRLLRLVRQNAQAMGVLIDDLLAFSRLSRQPLKKQNVAPADLARQALEELEHDRDGRRVEISIADTPQCQADPTLLKQVLVNLLSNALKYTRKREVGRIEVGCEERNDETVYFVKDNGAGFDMRYADKLFGVFQRLHRAEEYEGTGVGLAIVQRIIHRHGGSVWAEAETGKGATFYFTLSKEGNPDEP